MPAKSLELRHTIRLIRKLDREIEAALMELKDYSPTMFDAGQDGDEGHAGEEDS